MLLHVVKKRDMSGKYRGVGYRSLLDCNLHFLRQHCAHERRLGQP